jgi:hypothetical protein
MKFMKLILIIYLIGSYTDAKGITFSGTATIKPFQSLLLFPIASVNYLKGIRFKKVVSQ